MTDKIEQSIDLIRESAHEAEHPAVMLSFGKDAMVLASLIRDAFPSGLNGTHFPRPHAYPLPVIHYRDPWFSHKYEFADWMIRSWDMEVHDYPPYAAGVKAKEDRLELVSRYNFGNQGNGIDRPKCVKLYPRRDYICGLYDWVLRPKMKLAQYPWDLVFVGHKSCDVDEFEDAVPLKYDSAMADDVKLVFPLRHWTDDEIWEYIEKNHIPFQGTVYKDRKEVSDTWYNEDYTHACVRCVDPRETAPEVMCPKLRRMVPNVSSKVIQLREIPQYIEKD